MAEKQFATFFLDDEFLGIDISYVREIYRNPDITPVALAPDYISGLLNLRGQVITVIDLGVKLGRKERNLKNGTSCIVLKGESDSGEGGEDKKGAGSLVALLIDKIGDVISVDEKLCTPPPPNLEKFDTTFVSSIITLDDREFCDDKKI